MATVRKPPPPHIVVIGGGLAGLAAASCLADRGLRITILESRPRLGGRASSFPDPATGELVDNCQHLSMACCTNLADFCRKVGIHEMLRREPELVFLGPEGKVSRFRAGFGPAPFHLTGSFLKAHFLKPRDKLSVAYGLACLAWDRADRPGETAADWLRRHRQTERTIEMFWGPVLVSTLNEQLDRMDVGHVRKVFLDGFLRNRSGFQIELPLVPLGELYGRRLERWLEIHEVAVRLTTGVRSIEPDEDGAIGGVVLRTGERIAADFVVLAVPFDRADRLIADGLRDRIPDLSNLEAMQSSPVTGVHLWFDRPVCPFDHVVTLGRLIQWVFNHTAIQGRAAPAGIEPPRADDDLAVPAAPPDRGQYLQLVISASYDLLALDKVAIRDRVLAELAEVWPAAREATLLRWWVVTEHGATFAVRPGIEALRPPQRTPIDGLFLAGDWTDTGWPATMEGAVRSGYLAAQEILRDLDRPTRLIRPGLPSGSLARWLFGSAEYRPARSVSPLAGPSAGARPVSAVVPRPAPSPATSADRSPFAHGANSAAFGGARRKDGRAAPSAATISGTRRDRGPGRIDMRGGSSREVVRHLRTLYQFGVAGSLGDEQLLDRFLSRRDEASEEAFAELVQRHGPMVLGVCRRILGDAHDAEDAFQATFLVLARKAATVVRREKVASWLYGVAVRTAREARVRSARRRVREERVSMPIHVEPSDDGFRDELRDILDQELARLPARHRGPVVLCELEGLSRPEAARRLGIPEGTLSSRLARAKARLRDRLASRGVSLPVAAVSAILVREARAVTVPLSLLESTVQAATLVAAGPTTAAALALSASVASLSEGVIKTMLVAKLKGIALAVGTMTAVVSGAVVLAQSGSGPGPQPGQVGPQAGTKVTVRADQDDRAATLEKKLDRVLDALERLSRTPPPSRNDLGLDTPVEDRPTPEVIESVAVATSESPALAPTPEPDPAVPPPAPQLAPAQVPTLSVGRSFGPPSSSRLPRPPRQASMADRLQLLEQQMRQVQQHLERLEARLKTLDARVGGPEIENIPGPPTDRSVPPPRISGD